MRRALWALPVALLLGACGVSGPLVTDSTPSSPASTATSSPVTQAPAPPAATQQGVFGFGQTVTYGAGATPYSITVSAPVGFEPSRSAAGLAGGGTPVAVQVSVRNDGAAPLETTLMFAGASSGGVEAGRIFDAAKNVGSPPQTAVLPGQSVTWTAAFAVADPSSLVVQVPGVSYAYRDTIFTNAAA